MFCLPWCQMSEIMLVPALETKLLPQRNMCISEASFQLRLLFPEKALSAASDVGMLLLLNAFGSRTTAASVITTGLLRCFGLGCLIFLAE